MKFIKLFLLLIITYNTVLAQKATDNPYLAIDKKALLLPDSLTKTTDQIAGYINANFKTDTDKARGIFVWLASNIEYDIENMFALNFYETKEEKILKPLKLRKGICENYASLFTELCTKSGIKSFVIEGYTKQNGFADYIPHAWSAALIDSSWFLFDATWGSGYITGGKFIKKINNSYFKVSPASLIKSHMPFDYLWQFLNYPITNQEFYEGKIEQIKTKPFFNYKDSIQLYENQNEIDQHISSAYRVEKNGLKNSLIFDRYQHLKIAIETERNNKIVDLYNTAIIYTNEGVNAFNDFINYRNQQFKPKKTDPEIQAMLTIASNQFEAAKNNLDSIANPDANTGILIKQLTTSLNEASIQLKEQEAWLKTYFSKGKLGRLTMFYKVAPFGIRGN